MNENLVLYFVFLNPLLLKPNIRLPHVLVGIFYDVRYLSLINYPNIS